MQFFLILKTSAFTVQDSEQSATGNKYKLSGTTCWIINTITSKVVCQKLPQEVHSITCQIIFLFMISLHSPLAISVKLQSILSCMSSLKHTIF